MKTLFPSCSWTSPPTLPWPSRSTTPSFAFSENTISVDLTMAWLWRIFVLQRCRGNREVTEKNQATLTYQDLRIPLYVQRIRDFLIQSYDLGMGFFDHQSYEFSGGVWILKIVDASEIPLTGCSLVVDPIIFTRDLLHLRWCRIFSGQRCVCFFFLIFELWVVAVVR